MKITTQHCKEAIVKFILDNPGYVSDQFDPPESEEPAKLVSNWKRYNKIIEYRKGKAITVRSFDCKPYDDQLRATVYADEDQILDVYVQGE